MKKLIIIVLFGIIFDVNLFGQNVLPNYSGFWTEIRYPYNLEMQFQKIRATYVLEYYPDRLDIIRNEIYAKYGRPFVNKKYRDYFSAQSWYVEKPNYSDDWLTEYDRYNANFILSIEKVGHCYNAIVVAKKNGIIYEGLHPIHFPLFTSRTSAIGSEDLDKKPFITFEDRNWLVIGNWVIVYKQLEGAYEKGRYMTQNFLIDTITKKQIDYEVDIVDRDIFERFITRQESIKLQYVRGW
jgi:hypothetical protein